VEWINLAWDRDRWWALVNWAINLLVPYNVGNCITKQGTASTSELILLHGVQWCMNMVLCCTDWGMERTLKGMLCFADRTASWNLRVMEPTYAIFIFTVFSHYTSTCFGRASSPSSGGSNICQLVCVALWFTVGRTSSPADSQIMCSDSIK
jgi:hypothetical protein